MPGRHPKRLVLILCLEFVLLVLLLVVVGSLVIPMAAPHVEVATPTPAASGS